jgi:hypothetical protein
VLRGEDHYYSRAQNEQLSNVVDDIG